MLCWNLLIRRSPAVCMMAGSAANFGKGSGASVYLIEEGRMECTRCFRILEVGFMHIVVSYILCTHFSPLILITFSFPTTHYNVYGVPRNLQIHFCCIIFLQSHWNCITPNLIEHGAFYFTIMSGLYNCKLGRTLCVKALTCSLASIKSTRVTAACMACNRSEICRHNMV